MVLRVLVVASNLSPQSASAFLESKNVIMEGCKGGSKLEKCIKVTHGCSTWCFPIIKQLNNMLGKQKPRAQADGACVVQERPNDLERDEEGGPRKKKTSKFSEMTTFKAFDNTQNTAAILIYLHSSADLRPHLCLSLSYLTDLVGAEACK